MSGPVLKSHLVIAQEILREINLGRESCRQLKLDGSADGYTLGEQVGSEWLEMVVWGPDPPNAAFKAALATGEPTGGQQYLFAEVYHLCVCPGPNYQERARIDLERQKEHWREQLTAIRRLLDGEELVSIPFGRFVSANEGPSDWVPDLFQIRIDPSRLLEDGTTPESEVDIWVLKRPFILWPTYQTAGKFENGEEDSRYSSPILKTRVHVSHTRRGGSIHIARPTPRRLRDS